MFFLFIEIQIVLFLHTQYPINRYMFFALTLSK